MLLALTLQGCSNDFVANSAGVWPKIEVGSQEPLSPAALTALAEFSKLYPEDAKKIVGRNNELVAKIKEYNKRAREHNRELYAQIKMPPHDIDLLEP